MAKEVRKVRERKLKLLVLAGVVIAVVNMISFC